MFQSEQINELIGALAKAQGEMKPAVKDSSNPHFKSRYADLASVWEACRDALSKNNLAITQTLEVLGDKTVLVTLLGHSSGQWMKSSIPLPLQKPGPQEMGSCISYCRRYSLAAMVGVFQDDDDAEKAQTTYRQSSGDVSIRKQTNSTYYKESDKKLTEDQICKLKKISSQIDDEEYIEKLNSFLNVESILDVQPKDYGRALASLEKKLKELQTNIEVKNESNVA